MTSADEYRLKAAKFSELAQSQESRKLQLEYAKMAASYFRLAELAERNAGNDLVYEPPFEQGPTSERGR